ncbi:hypothetical protein [Catenovulum sediminis]|uniref:Uncharacterized protein n=1 Tax=Catenovulum sediminis TaxID=1740262 RepID=A0ABV1RJ56_9ALTE
MKITNRIKLEEITDNFVYLYIDGIQIAGTFSGRTLEAQYEVYDWLLAILELDPEHIIFYLIDESGSIIDQQTIGHWNFESLFESPKVIDPQSLEFVFGTRGKLKVLKIPEYSMLSRRKCHLQFENVAIDD